MATFNLTGSGVQTLSADATALHITIAELPDEVGTGDANPLDYFGVGLLRLGDAVAFFDALPVVGGPQWVGLPLGCTRFGYALGESEIDVEEVIGGDRPFCCGSTDGGDGGGGGGDLVLIGSQTIVTPVPSVTFSSIPGTYSALRLMWQTRSDQAAGYIARLRINADTGNNYAYSGYNLGGSAFTSSATNHVRLGVSATSAQAAGIFSAGEAQFPFYAQTVTQKVWMTSGWRADAALGELVNGVWRNTAAITTLTVDNDTGVGNLVAGCAFALYGLT